MADTYPLIDSPTPVTAEVYRMPDDIRVAVAALAARMDDLVDRVDRVQATATQTQIQAAQNVIETRAVVDRLDRLNGSVQNTVRRVDSIESSCRNHEEDSASLKLQRSEIAAIRSTLADFQMQRKLDEARAAGGASVWAQLRPWIERGSWLAIGLLLYLLLDHGQSILSHLKVGP